MIDPGDPVHSFRNLAMIINHTLQEVRDRNDTKHPIFNTKAVSYNYTLYVT